MSIKSQGGVFGRNPTFNDVTVEGDLSIDGTLSVGGETITGLSYQGGWNASTNSPDIAASSPVTGQFWIVSADGSTNVGGITNWTSGDWALYDGTNWQRVEGGNTDLTTGVQGQLAIANGGTGAADASTARTNLGLGSAATTASTDYATAAQGSLADSAIQAADLGTAAYTASTDYATAAQGSLADSAVQPAAIANMLETTDIGSTVQAYDADTAKLDVAQTFTAAQTFSNASNYFNNNLAVKDTLDLKHGTPYHGVQIGARLKAEQGVGWSDSGAFVVYIDNGNNASGEVLVERLRVDANGVKLNSSSGITNSSGTKVVDPDVTATGNVTLTDNECFNSSTGGVFGLGKLFAAQTFRRDSATSVTISFTRQAGILTFGGTWVSGGNSTASGVLHVWCNDSTVFYNVISNQATGLGTASFSTSGRDLTITFSASSHISGCFMGSTVA